MKILNLSLDQSLLNPESVSARRILAYGDLTERYLVVVPARFDSHLNLSPQVSVLGIGGRYKLSAAWRLWTRVAEILTDQAFDLLTVQDAYFLAFITWRLARTFSLPWEIQVHGFERFSGLRKVLARYLLPKATGVRTVSQRLREQLITQFGVSAAKISVLPIRSDFKCDLEAPLIPKIAGDFVFLTVARLVSVKNIAGILAALVKVRELHPTAKLWVVGDGPERQRLERLSASLDLHEAVKFWGRRTDLSSFYRSADAFVLFSNSEGWGLSVLEAGACSLPVVMSDVGCAGELVKDGQSGLVVGAGDDPALAAAMSSLLADSTLRQNLAKGLSQELKALASQSESLEAYRGSWTKLILNQP